jgi:KDO2-lipid IV(A) lauroyltransferase
LKPFVAVWLWFGRRPAWVFDLFAVLVSVSVASLVWTFGAERRFVLLKNLALCFPQASHAWRYRTGFAHMVLYVRTFLDRAWVWQQPESVIRQRVQIQGLERLRQAQCNPDSPDSVVPVILLAPHFLGLDAGWTRLCLDVQMVTMYSNQKNPILNDLLRRGRARFGDPVLLSRQEGVRGILKNLKQGKPLYYLPDMDFGEKDAVFVPFFGVNAATVTAVARLSRMTGARVVFCPTRWQRQGLMGGKYTMEIMTPLADYPSADDTQATARINSEIEKLIADYEAQYLWTHKRFKTRPSGEAGFYGRYHH